VVFMSGYSAMPPPDWQFIAKPFDRHLLLTKISDLLPVRRDPAVGAVGS